MIKKTVIAFSVITLCGCSTQPKVKGTVLKDDPDKPIKIAMLKMSERIDKSLRVLAEVKNAEIQTSLTQEEMTRLEWENNIVPPNMDAQMTFDWVGGAEQPLTMIAEYCGYKFKGVGKKPVIMPVVSVKSQARSAIDIVRDIASQLGSSATVQVLPSTKTITLMYGSHAYQD